MKKPTWMRLRGAQETWLLLCVVVMLIATLWTLILWFSASQKQRLLDENQHELVQLRSAVARHTEGLLGSVATDLRVIDLWLQANPHIDPLTDTAFNGLVEGMRRASDGLIDPRMVSSDGQLYYLPGRRGQPLADVSDRDYYRTPMRSTLPRALHIGEPVLSRVTGKWGIPISWRLERAVGGMQLVFVNIELDRLVAFHEQFRVKPNGSILLLRSDGTVLSRAPQDLKILGKNISDRPGMDKVLAQAQGSFSTNSPLTDGLPRLASFENLPTFPVLVLVTRGEQDALSTYYERRKVVLLVAGFLTVFALWLAWTVARAQRATRKEKAAHAAISAELIAGHDASPWGLFRCDLNGHMTYVNDEWRRIHKLPAPLNPDDWQIQIHPDYREAVTAQWRLAAATPAPFEGTRPMYFSDGSWALLSVKSKPVVVDGAIIGRVGTVEDTTERTANEKAQRTLNAIFELTTDLVVQSDPESRLMYLNPAARRFLGIAPNVPLDSYDPRKFVPQWVLEKRRKEMVPTALREGVWVGETAAFDAQGNEVPMSYTLIAHRDKAGTVDRFSGILRDISPFKNAQNALRQSEQRLRSIADRLPMRVCYIDLEERYRFTNAAYQAAFGMSHTELSGRTVREILGEVAYQVAEPHIKAALRGENVTFENEITTLEGYRSYRATYVPQFDDDGTTPIGVVAIISDVTRQKQEERRLIGLSHQDALTGLLNRAGFDKRLGEAMGRARGTQLPLALLFLDIDHFKPVNDTYGHLMGDLLLQGFAGRLTKVLRASDTVARLGGDEFTIILEGLERTGDAALVAANVVKAMQAPFLLEAQSIQISTSIGVTLYAGEERVTAKALVNAADEQLYAAKASGRNQFKMRATPSDI